jgi:SAM-dependent methyltransferase
MDIREHNRAAWDAQVERQNRWTVPVSRQVIEAARQGRWEIVLTPTKPIPRIWFGEVAGRDVLCLASGGGQQAPILAAAGALVTVVDNSPKQLERDSQLAREHGLSIRTVLGDMANLDLFRDETFDIIVHPVSNCFVPDVEPVWTESFRVLRRGGALLAGFTNPVVYMFDQDEFERGRLEVKHRLPYSDADSLSSEQIAHRWRAGVPLEFSHTLESLIGGQLRAGFALTGMYEDRDPPDETSPLSGFTPIYIATRAIRKLAGD